MKPIHCLHTPAPPRGRPRAVGATRAVSPEQVTLSPAAQQAATRELVDWWYEQLPPGARRVAYLEHEGQLFSARRVRREVLQGTELGRLFRGRFLAPYHQRQGKTYKVKHRGRTVESEVPGIYGGYRKMKIYGRLDCGTGKRMLPENRVFFLTLQDAIDDGYRACGNCRPHEHVFKA